MEDSGDAVIANDVLTVGCGEGPGVFAAKRRLFEVVRIFGGARFSDTSVLTLASGISLV